MLSVQDPSESVEDRLGTVAVVDVPVEDQHPFGAALGEGVRGGDSHVVEQAEAHRPVALGVVPGRAQAAEGEAAVAGEQALRGPGGASGRVERCFVGPCARPRCPGRSSRRPVGRTPRSHRCAPRCGRASMLARRPRAPRPARLPASRARSIAASIGDAGVRRSPDGRRCRAGARTGGDVEEHSRGTVAARLAQSTANPSSTSPSSAAEPPACTSRFAPPRRAAGPSWSRASRSPRAPATGPRAGWRRHWRPATPPSSTRSDTLEAGRGPAGRRRSRCSRARRRTRSHELQARGVQFDTDPEGGLALGLEGGHSARRIVHAGGSRDGARDHGLPRLRGGSRHGLAVLEGSVGRPAGATERNARESSPTPGEVSAPRHRPRHRGRRGAMGAHDQSLGGDRRRGRDGACRRGRVGRPRVLPVPSHRAVAARQRRRRQAHHRGRARRGGPCSTRAGSSSPTSSPHATR